MDQMEIDRGGRKRYGMRHHAPLAQLDRALPSEGRGQTFESSGVHQIKYRQQAVF